MWSWSPEGVEPAESSWQEGAHLSVLQRCGDAVKPGEEPTTVFFQVQSSTMKHEGARSQPRLRLLSHAEAVCYVPESQLLSHLLGHSTMS